MFAQKNTVRENKHIRHQQQDWSNEKEFGKKIQYFKNTQEKRKRRKAKEE